MRDLQQTASETKKQQDESEGINSLFAAVEGLRRQYPSYPDSFFRTLALSVIWNFNTNTSSVVVWMFLHLFQEPDVASQVRDEIQKYVQIKFPPPVFGVPELPQIKIDSAGLVDSCPLFWACYVETLRLHGHGIVDTASVEKDFNISTPAGSSRRLSRISKVTVHHSLLAMDPVEFPVPNKFNPSRHLVDEGKASPYRTIIGQKGTLAAWLDAFPSPSIAEHYVLSFVASTLLLWNFRPLRPSQWVLPSNGSGPVCHPGSEIQIGIKRRTGNDVSRH